MQAELNRVGSSLEHSEWTPESENGGQTEDFQNKKQLDPEEEKSPDHPDHAQTTETALRCNATPRDRWLRSQSEKKSLLPVVEENCQPNQTVDYLKKD